MYKPTLYLFHEQRKTGFRNLIFRNLMLFVGSRMSLVENNFSINTEY